VLITDEFNDMKGICRVSCGFFLFYFHFYGIIMENAKLKWQCLVLASLSKLLISVDAVQPFQLMSNILDVLSWALLVLHIVKCQQYRQKIWR